MRRKLFYTASRYLLLNLCSKIQFLFQVCSCKIAVQQFFSQCATRWFYTSRLKWNLDQADSTEKKNLEN